MQELFPTERNPEGFVYEAFGILEEAVKLYQPSKMFGMFSGGHDSLAAVHVASKHKLFAGACHINTGIGVEQTRQFVRDTCKREGWPLLEYRSKITYESLVLKYGFPGGPGHGMMYTRLKERCIRQLIREHKTHLHDRIMLVGGMRYTESVRRMGNAEPHHREGVRVWCSPIVNWTVDERNQYIDMLGLPKNPVVAKLCMSGECLCGAFAHKNEMVELEHHFPEVAQQIHELEAKAKAAGKHCVWGTKPPCKNQDEQRPDQPELFSLCWSCGQKNQGEHHANQAS